VGAWIWRKVLLTHNHTQAAAPAFGYADPDDFDRLQQMPLEQAGSRVESQRGRDEINERWSFLQFQLRKIAVLMKVALFEMLGDAEPVVGGLERQMNVLRGFEFDDGEAAGCCDCENVENAAFRGGIREQLLRTMVSSQRSA
jgi:hypothetical protein